jgi:hypothetical protein
MIAQRHAESRTLSVIHALSERHRRGAEFAESDVRK